VWWNNKKKAKERNRCDRKDHPRAFGLNWRSVAKFTAMPLVLTPQPLTLHLYVDFAVFRPNINANNYYS